MRLSFFAILISLALSPAALAQSQTACALRQPEAPRPRGHGTVIQIQDPALARASIPAREAQRGGTLDQHYRDDMRAVVKEDNGVIDTFDVPEGMTVHAGERVRLQGSYRSPGSACSYIPHLAIPDDVPAA